MSLSELTLYEILEVHPTATEDAIRAAYFRLAKLYHPDLRRSDQKPEDTEKFIEINRAYTTLSDAGKRQAYDMELRQAAPPEAAATIAEIRAADPPSAQSDGSLSTWTAQKDAGRAYLKAEQLVDEGRYKDAARLLLAILKIEPSNPVYLSLTGYALAAVGEGLHRARDCCRRAVEMEPYNATYLARLGFVYERAGLDSLAERYYAEALQIDPAQSLARPRPRRVDAKSGGGLMGSLRAVFGR
jgi:curved DNA-binding protein CbpA